MRLKDAELPVERLWSLFVWEKATGRLLWWPERVAKNVKWLDEAGCIKSHGYRGVRINGKLYRAHRIIWAMHTGQWPEDELDHINGDRLDNRLENLRPVSCQENMRNAKRYCNNKSGVMGVYWHKAAGKWRAQIMVNGRQIHLGYFAAKEEAIAARKAAETMYGFHENHGRG
jgi:hypothetical protein